MDTNCKDLYIKPIICHFSFKYCPFILLIDIIIYLFFTIGLILMFINHTHHWSNCDKITSAIFAPNTIKVTFYYFNTNPTVAQL